MFKNKTYKYLLFQDEQEENEDDNTIYELDSLVLQRALRFDPPPQKSSLKSNSKQESDRHENRSKNVRFFVAEQPKFPEEFNTLCCACRNV